MILMLMSAWHRPDVTPTSAWCMPDVGPTLAVHWVIIDPWLGEPLTLHWGTAGNWHQPDVGPTLVRWAGWRRPDVGHRRRADVSADVQPTFNQCQIADRVVSKEYLHMAFFFFSFSSAQRCLFALYSCVKLFSLLLLSWKWGSIQMWCCQWQRLLVG